jgi:uncharacterized protein with HEPN domain
MSKADKNRINDMLEAAQKAISFTQGRSREDLERDEVLALAVSRLLEIIGEASRHVPDEVKDAHPEVPWPEIAAVRNRLIHGYFAVDLDIVWVILQQDLPALALQLQAILDEP